jgi:hypothetical protein
VLIDHKAAAEPLSNPLPEGPHASLGPLLRDLAVGGSREPTHHHRFATASNNAAYGLTVPKECEEADTHHRGCRGFRRSSSDGISSVAGSCVPGRRRFDQPRELCRFNLQIVTLDHLFVSGVRHALKGVNGRFQAGFDCLDQAFDVS